MTETNDKHTLSALVENRAGVLFEITSRFQQYDVNIKSISAGETENPDITRMVICVQASDDEVRAIQEDLAAMPFVIQADDLSRKEFVDRELVLIKVAMDREQTPQLMQVFEVFRATVVGMGQETITVEMSGDSERVDGLITMLAPYGIKSMCRTGKIALKRGDD